MRLLCVVMVRVKQIPRRSFSASIIHPAGVAFGKTMAEAMSLKLDAENPKDREKSRRAVLDLVARRKIPKQKGQGEQRRLYVNTAHLKP